MPARPVRRRSKLAAATEQQIVRPRRIWLCADDYGIAPGVNTAIRDLIGRGRLNATSVMVVAPSFTQAEADALVRVRKAGDTLAIGLHVTLTAPFRPLSGDFAPLRNDAFLPLGAMLGSALARRLQREKLRAEITAQLQAFAAAFGRPPDFIDGHQHVQLFPVVRDAVLEVGKRAAPNAWMRQCGRTLPWRQMFSNPKALLLDLLSRDFRQRARAQGVRTNPAFAGAYDFKSEGEFAALFARFLHRLPDGGLIMCHPGFVDAELQRLDPLTTQREREHAFFSGAAFLTMLASEGVALA
jgi:chitin disaccharide deacetylase